MEGVLLDVKAEVDDAEVCGVTPSIDRRLWLWLEFGLVLAVASALELVFALVLIGIVVFVVILIPIPIPIDDAVADAAIEVTLGAENGDAEKNDDEEAEEGADDEFELNIPSGAGEMALIKPGWRCIADAAKRESKRLDV